MKREDEFERMIEELPSRGLSAGAAGRIEAAMARAAGAAGSVESTRPAPWWSRGVPLWLAAAACLAMCAATALLMQGMAGAGAGAEPVIAQGIDEDGERLESDAAPEATASGQRTDIARWKVLEVRTETPS